MRILPDTIISFGVFTNREKIGPEIAWQSVFEENRIIHSQSKFLGNINLSEDKMCLRQIVISVPEKILLVEKTDEISFARELRILAAVKLYELGRLSSGRAAELADMTRVEFLLSLGRYKVFPFQSELNDLEKQYA